MSRLSAREQHAERQHDRDDEDQVAAEVGEQRRDANAEVIEQRLCVRRDQRHADDLLRARRSCVGSDPSSGPMKLMNRL